MTTPLRQRRRAERFAQLLDEANGGRRQRLRTPDDAELTPLVGLPQRLLSNPLTPELDPEFRAGLRAMLVATADREGIGAGATLEQPSPLRRVALSRGPRARTAIVAGVAVGAVALTGMSTASESAVPGDPLYGVKRSTERAQLALASSDVGRGQLYLDFARNRLQEAQLLASDLDRVLNDMDRDTSHGVRLLTTAAASRNDRAALDVVNGFVSYQQAALEELRDRVGNGDRERVTQSLALLEAIEDRARDLRTGLDRSCPASTSIDALGPVPNFCVALPPPELLNPPARAASAPQKQAVPQPVGMAAAGAAGYGSATQPTPEPAQPPAPSGSSQLADEAELPGASATDRPAPVHGLEHPSKNGRGLFKGLHQLLGNLLRN